MEEHAAWGKRPEWNAVRFIESHQAGRSFSRNLSVCLFDRVLGKQSKSDSFG